MKIVVQTGDTLWDLAAKHLGDPFLWDVIFNKNIEAIRQAQIKFNKNRRGPHWIYPGIILEI